MVYCFDRDDLLAQFGVVRLQVLDEFGLGVGRADDEDFLRALERFRDLVEVALVFGYAPGGLRAALEVQVAVRLALDELGLDGFLREVQDVGFDMVDPDDGVKVGHG